MNKSLLEKREDGKYKLIENYIIPNNMIRKIPLKEETKIIEHEGKQYKCISAYTFPISRPNQENYNERIYTDKLWENVIKNQKEVWGGSFGLCDHPKGDDEGSVKDAWCVWHNLRFNEDRTLILADAYLFGKWGEHAKQALEAGGKIGLSSVGYGDFKEDGKTIDESTYELERPADWVLNPSYGVFGYISDEINVENKQDNFKKEEDKALSENKNTNNTEEKIKKENNVMSKQDILLEKNFRWYIESELKNIDKIESLHEKLTALEGLLENFEDVDFADDLKEKIISSINTIKEEMGKLAEKGRELESVKNSKENIEKEKEEITEKYEDLENKYKELQEKYDTAIIMLDDLKVYTNKLKDLYDLAKAEANGKVSASEYKELVVFTENLQKEYEELKREFNKLKKEQKMKSLRRKRESMIGLSRKRINTNLKNVNDKVLEYYNDLYDNDPRVEVIKEEILKCDNLFEAQKTYLHLKSLFEDVPSPYKPSSLRERKFARKIKEVEKEEEDTLNNEVSITRIKREGWI